MIFDKGYTIRVAEERCLNQRHNRVECDHCVKNCPAGAILILKNHVAIDKDICTSCGLCLSDCPTEVFYSNQWDETTISKEVDLQGWKTTEFFCAEHAEVHQKDEGREKGSVRLPACLSSISRGAWFELGLKTEIDLHIEQCDGCPMEKTVPQLAYNVSTAAEWLVASGHTSRINFVNWCENDPSKKCREVVNAGLKVTSRRDLFLSLIRHAKQATKGAEVDTVRTLNEDRLPRWRKRFAKVYQDNAIEGSPAAYWPTIKVNDDCVNCGMCSLFCPSKTLQITRENGIARHSFTSGTCLDCRICKMVCSVGAISRDREKVEKPFETITLSTVPVSECKRCGDTTTKNVDGLCYWCRQEDAIEADLKNTYRNMFLNKRQ
jgi:Pyruvate/2-oxoacid:ferredoxin oxidoreductase delta subunit